MCILQTYIFSFYDFLFFISLSITDLFYYSAAKLTGFSGMELKRITD